MEIYSEHPVHQRRGTTPLTPSIFPIFSPHFRLYEVTPLHMRVLPYEYPYAQGYVAYHEPTVMIGHITAGS